MRPFKVESPFEPSGDQPQAIEALAQGFLNGERFQTLKGVTGSGKTFTMAKIIERIQRPTLIISRKRRFDKRRNIPPALKRDLLPC